MEKDLIQVVNRLQDVFGTIGGETVDLPQIVVLGSQSSGKSSVLETVVGRDFLPRGSGIVTRRPLILQLVHLPSTSAPTSASEPSSSFLTSSSSSSSNPSTTANSAAPYTVPSSQPSALYPTSSTGTPSPQSEYGEFLHLGGRRFYDFNEIRREIEQETARVAGANKGISRLPIHLKVYSEKVLNLTLVDLPGLTKIPVGDQPSDIEKQIRNLVLDYISKPNCVILAISPANVDLANSDSLKLARSVDPQGRRTIGVLTKLDLMDAGTNALDVLTGRVYPLKLGFIGVVNRSQQDINASKPMDEAISSEAEFFRTHPGYRNIAHRCGTKYLAKTLNQVLLSHIRDKLPDMKARLNTLMGQTQQELNAFGDTTFLGEQHRGSLILKLMTQFVRDFVSSIDGTSFEVSTKELCGGARIYYIFNDVFGHALDSINPTMNLTVQDIRTAIRNSTGPRPSLFVPELAFDLLIKPQIRLLEPPSLRCVELVYEELMKICHNCTSTELQRYPRLHAQIIEVVSELLRERLGPTSEYVQSLIAIQAAYINTNHPAFVAGTAQAAKQSAHDQAVQQAQRRKEIEGSSNNRSFDADENGVISSLDDEDEMNGGYSTLPNGRSSVVGEPKNRSTSSTISSRSSNRAIGPGSGHHRTMSPTTAGGGGAYLGPPTSSSPTLHSTSPSANAAKDTFLNYFFGGAANGGPGGPLGPAGGGRLAGGYDVGVVGSGGVSSSGFGNAGGPRSDNPLAGRKGLEGTAAAFDMKSLEKHLEPTPPEAGFALTEREEMETSLIRNLIASYFGIVRQTIQDIVPKAIMHMLVINSRENIQNRLVSSLYKESLFDELLFEDEGLTSERNRVKTLLDAYKEAFKVLSEVL